MKDQLQTQASEKLYQYELTKNMGDVVTRWNTEGLLVFANRSFEDYTGIAPEAAEGLEYTQVTHCFGGKRKWQQGFRRCIVSGKAVTVTAEAEAKRDEPMIFETEICPEYNEDRELKGFIAVTREITRKSETRSRTERLACSALLIADLAAEFISALPEHKNDLYSSLLSRCGSVIGGDRAFLFSYDFEAGKLHNTYEWCGEGITSEIEFLQNLPVNLFPELTKTHLSGRPYIVRDTGILHPESETRKILELQGVKTLITAPVGTEGDCTGFIGIDYLKHSEDVGPEEVHLLTTLARFIRAFEAKYVAVGKKKP